MKAIQKMFVLYALMGSAFALSGCSTGEENPITPDRMNEIRKQEAEERANFNPSTTPPPAPSR